MTSEKEKAAERYEKRTFPEGWTIRKAFLAGWNERDKHRGHPAGCQRHPRTKTEMKKNV